MIDSDGLTDDSIAELYAGVRDGQERHQLDAFIAPFTVLHRDGTSAQRAGLRHRQYGRSQRLIAAAGASTKTQGRKRRPASETPSETP